MENWFAVLEAANTAARWHVNQRRKGADGDPYINHLLEVALLVAEATEGRDPELVIAALLHDAIEDRGVEREEIASRFGQGVADLVVEVTDDKSLPKAERKRLQVETASGKSPRAKLLKLADKTSNLRAIATSPPAGWNADRKLEYVRWAREVGRGLRGVSPCLERSFEEAAAAAEASLERLRSHPQRAPAEEMSSAAAVAMGRAMQATADVDPDGAAWGRHLEKCGRAAMAAGLATVPRRMLASSPEEKGTDPVTGFTTSTKN